MAEDVVTPVNDPPVQRKFKLSKSWSWAALFIVLLAIVVGVIWHVRDHQVEKRNDAFVINGQQYSKSYAKSVISFVVSEGYVSQSTALAQLYIMLKTQTAAKEVGIVPLSSEVNSEYSALEPLASNNKYTTEWYKLKAFMNSLPATYTLAEEGNYVGYSFAFEFGLRIEAAIEPSLIPGYGNKALIAQDKSYASQEATYYYNLFKANKIKPETLISDINNNKRIAYNPISAPFNTRSPYTLQDQVDYPSIVSFIEAQTKTGISTIQTGKVETTLDPTSSKNYADGFYFFVDLTKASAPIPNPQQVINNAISKLHTAYYGL